MFIYLNLFFYFSRSTSCEIKLCVVGKKGLRKSSDAANDHIRNTNFWILSHLIRNTLDWFLNLFFFALIFLSHLFYSTTKFTTHHTQQIFVCSIYHFILFVLQHVFVYVWVCVYANNPFRPELRRFLSMRSALLSLKLPIWIFRFVNIHTLCAYVCLCLRTLRCVCVCACVCVCVAGSE